MKKALALIMSVCMILSMAVMASAKSVDVVVDSNYTIELIGTNSILDSNAEYTVTYTIVDSGFTDSGTHKVKYDATNTPVQLGKTYTAKSTKIDVNVTIPSSTTYTVEYVKLENNKFIFELSKWVDHNSGGGSGGGGGSHGSIIGGNKATGTTSTGGSVSAATASANTTKAVSAAVKAAVASGSKTANATVTLKNAGKITPAVFNAIVNAANKASKNVNVTLTVQADTVVNGKVVARMYIDPAAAAKAGKTVDTTMNVAANSKLNSSIAAKFEKFFKNDIEVVSFNQKGAFGMTVSVAVKVDLSALNTKTLAFYSYDAATNKYEPIANTEYFVDTNGYLHFNTTVGNSVVITDSPLTQK